jgi:hypothetical protein
VAPAVKGDIETPKGLAVGFDQALFEAAPIEVKASVREPESVAGVTDGIPTCFGGGGGGQGVGEGTEGDLIAEVATEGTRDQHAAGDVELDIAQVLNAEPCSGTEDENYEAAVMILGDGRQQREASGETAGAVEQERSPSRGDAPREEAVVDVSGVGGHDGLLSQEAAGDGQAGIEKRDSQGD